MSSLPKKLSKIADFSKCYRKICDGQKQAMRISSWNEVLADWWLGLRFFFDRAFYQGRRNELSSRFEQATLQALDEVLGTSADSRKSALYDLYDGQFLGKANFSKRENPLAAALQEEYEVDGKKTRTGKEGDNLMVSHVLRFVCEKAPARREPLNLVGYIKHGIENNNVRGVAQELDAIYQVGKKIHSLLIRDVVDLFALSDSLRPQDFKYVQAVDTWVEQLANKLGFQGSKKQLAENLAEACRRYAVDPVAFNQGAWYLASKSFDVLLDNIEKIEPPR